MKKICLFFVTLFMFFPLIASASTVTTIEEYTNALNDEEVNEVKLGADIEITSSDVANGKYYANIGKGKTLDLNGHTLTHGEDVYASITFNEDNATLTITDSVGTGKMFVDENFGEVHNTYQNNLIKLKDFDYENTHYGTAIFYSYCEEPVLMLVEGVDFFYPKNSPLSNGFDVIVKSLTVTVTGDDPVGFYNDDSTNYVFNVVHPDSVVYCNGYLVDDWENTKARDVFIGGNAVGHQIVIKDHVTITFETNGGNAINSINTNKGTIYRDVKPANPTKEDYVFAGWYMDDEFNTVLDDPYKVESDITAYAKWIVPNYVEEVSITGIKTPYVGNVPTVEGLKISEGLTIKNANWYEDKAEWDIEKPATKFEKGKRYMLMVEVELEDGYFFDEEFSEDNLTTNLEYLKAEFVKEVPDFRIYYEAKAAPVKPATPTLLNPYTKEIDNKNVFVDMTDYNNGVYSYELSINTTNYLSNEEYTVDGFEVYEKSGDEYIFVNDYEMGSPIIMNVSIGSKKTLVARVYVDVDGDKLYSNYSKEFVIDHTKPRTPTIKNPYGTHVDVEGDIYKYELGLDFNYYTLGNVNAEGEPHYIADGYELYDKSGDEYVFVSEHELGSAALVDVQDGTSRTLVARVFVINGSSEKVYSNYSKEFVIDRSNLPVSKPVIKTHNANNNTLLIDWEEVKYAKKYAVYRSTDKKKYDKIATVTDNKYTDTGLTYGKTYYYKVKAYNDKYNKTSDVVSGKTKPNKMTLNIKSAGTDNVKLNWDKVKVTGYSIYSSTDNKNWEKVKNVEPSSTLEYKVKSLKANKTYYFKARAYKTVSGEKVYGSYSEVVSTKTAPVKSEITLVLKDYDKFNIKFTASKGAAYYKIGLDDVKTFDDLYEEEIFDTVEELKFTDIPTGMTIYARVKACNSQNRCSGWNSTSLKITPKTPKLTVESKATKKVNVTVGSVNGVEGYKVYRSTSKNGKYEMIKEIKDPAELSFTDKTKKGVTYYYKVRAYTTGYDSKRVYSPYSGIKKIVSK